MTTPSLWLAYDHIDTQTLMTFLKQWGHYFRGIKIGLEKFIQHGQAQLHLIKQHYPHLDIFLDLKLHDIPMTVFKAIEQLAHTPINYLTVHLSGGQEMLLMAKKAQQLTKSDLHIIGVTILTSLDEADLHQLWPRDSLDYTSLLHRYLSLAQLSGIQHLVVSPKDLTMITDSWKKHFQFFCPGLRFEEDPIGDQKRICTPQEAVAWGAHHLIMGRSLTSHLQQPPQLQSRLDHIKSLIPFPHNQFPMSQNEIR
jgi:orotidine-5'-phosphate decarboxylase